MTRRRRPKRESLLLQELRERNNRIHELEQELRAATYPLRHEVNRLELQVKALAGDLQRIMAERREMLLWCPACGERHIDEGEFATKEHHTHACQKCGMVWRPAIGPTFGVRYLPGFKNGATPQQEALELLRRLRELRPSIAVVGHSERPREIIDELVAMVSK